LPDVCASESRLQQIESSVNNIAALGTYPAS
jgi:hypothetical protein